MVSRKTQAKRSNEVKITKSGHLQLGNDEQKDNELLNFVLRNITIVRDVASDRITISTGIGEDPFFRFAPEGPETEGDITYVFVDYVV